MVKKQNILQRSTILAANKDKARKLFYNYPNYKKKTRTVLSIDKIKKHPTLKGNIYKITHKQRVRGEVTRKRLSGKTMASKGLVNPEYQ